MNSKKLLIVLVVALAVFGLASPSRAGLNAVDPGTPPGTYTEAFGFFPQWYQDTFGTALELCLSPATIAAGARPALGNGAALTGGPACTLLANLGPPVVFDPALPMVFPSNFPDESFWFMGDASITTVGGVDVTYVSALEAAFGGGNPAVNDQISFARIRIRVDLPTDAPAGAYTVIHPYGVEVFELEGGGTKVINMTRDIGVAGPGDFFGALKGDIGPFLVDASVPDLGLIPGTNPVTGLTELFIGDPNTPRPVVGSPFGTNFVRLEGPAGFAPVQTNLFNVMGKVFPGALATPLLIERTSYSRGSGDQTDVFVKAPPTGTAEFVDTAGNLITMASDAFGQFFGQSTAPNPIPLALINVTADNTILGNTVSTGTSPLVDLVTISRAEYILSTGTLTVEASSSDAVAIPGLSLTGFGVPPTVTGTIQTFTTSLVVPPARVTVTSTNGGSDTEEVVLLP